jgi:hypothetical protein
VEPQNLHDSHRTQPFRVHAEIMCRKGQEPRTKEAQAATAS